MFHTIAQILSKTMTSLLAERRDVTGTMTPKRGVLHTTTEILIVVVWKSPGKTRDLTRGTSLEVMKALLGLPLRRSSGVIRRRIRAATRRVGAMKGTVTRGLELTVETIKQEPFKGRAK